MAREHRTLLRDPRARARIGLSITPMIDVVFQLLIYFLLTAGFMGNERHLRAQMPSDAPDTAAEQAPMALERDPLVIRVASGDGAPAIELGGGLAAPRDTADLERILRDAIVSPAQPSGFYASDHPIRIAAAPDVPWQQVVEVFNAVVSAGYRSVAFGGRP